MRLSPVRNGKALSTTELRAHFALRLSALYGAEVPAYTTLVEVSQEVNQRVLDRLGPQAERLGTISRVTAERHGAIRVGSAREMAQVARVFAAFGMFPTGFYDLRDAAPAPIPVVSTAFRPQDRDELAKNPFRVFTSMLVPEDRRFFDADLQARIERFVDGRELFPPELLVLADRAAALGGLKESDALRLLDLATAAFALSPDPVDRAWYAELEGVSSVAADIAGVGSTHINHLTPRVLDIDDLQSSMTARGIQMIDHIQGPPAWEGPDVLLRQTSFRALAEPRLFREVDGTVAKGSLRVRFGEVEQRGIALAAAGRALYDAMTIEADERAREAGISAEEAALRVWRDRLPTTERGLCENGLGFFTYTLAADRPSGPPPTDLVGLVQGGWLDIEPIVYEDFLPRSAAGIFSSNLTSEGASDESAAGAARDLDWMSEIVGREVAVPENLYAAESEASLSAAVARL